MTTEASIPAPLEYLAVTKVNQGIRSETQENVISETSVTLTINGEEWFNFLCTPLYLEALAVGFLFTSQIIKTHAEISSLKICADGSGLDVWLSHPAKKPELWQKNSGCSGGVSVPEVELPQLSSAEKFTLRPAEVEQILTAFYASQPLYQASGGVHTSAIFSGTKLSFLAEDIGRHNTLDKLAGMKLISGDETSHPIIVTTGRISLEMMQKAAMLRTCFVISRTSPTAASVELAQQLGISLIGYAEPENFKVYAHPEQISG